MVKKLSLAIALATALVPGAARADEGVTPEEVIAKVREGAAYLAKEGEAGLAEFERAGSPYVWKDTYIFVWNCSADVIVAHPVAASRGLKISSLKGADGKPYGEPMCAAAKEPGGSWGEYVWPKPVGGADGEITYTKEAFRKVSYMIAVDGQPYQLGAGIYNDPMTIPELDALVPK